jgi:exosome complex RNA-binding protein Rrp4
MITVEHQRVFCIRRLMLCEYMRLSDLIDRKLNPVLNEVNLVLASVSKVYFEMEVKLTG